MPVAFFGSGIVDEEFAVEERFTGITGAWGSQTRSAGDFDSALDDGSPVGVPDGQARLGSLELVEGFAKSLTSSIALLDEWDPGANGKAVFEASDKIEITNGFANAVASRGGFEVERDVAVLAGIVLLRLRDGRILIVSIDEVFEITEVELA